MSVFDYTFKVANNNAEDTLKELENKLADLKDQTDANKSELEDNCVKWDDLGLLFSNVF